MLAQLGKMLLSGVLGGSLMLTWNLMNDRINIEHRVTAVEESSKLTAAQLAAVLGQLSKIQDKLDGVAERQQRERYGYEAGKLRGRERERVEAP